MGKDGPKTGVEYAKFLIPNGSGSCWMQTFLIILGPKIGHFCDPNRPKQGQRHLIGILTHTWVKPGPNRPKTIFGYHLKGSRIT